MRALILTFCLSLILSLESFSQIVFEKGYFIDNSNQKVECLIKNVGWRNNPTEFEYKLSQSSAIKTGTLQDVMEFGISDEFKYVRSTTKIDKSSYEISRLDFNRNPIFEEETLFLKVLIEGQATLYHYVDKNLIRFFFSVNDSEISQLVYKRFFVEDKINGGRRLSINNYYQQQLMQSLECSSIDKKSISKLSYAKRDLVKLFVLYNECADPNFVNFQTKVKRDVIDFYIRPGLKSSSLSVNNSYTDLTAMDFGGQAGFRLGAEIEFKLPFNKNKWSILFEPTYQYFNAERT